ncbi:MAG: ferritin family protein [Caldiserica bacterium]|nr:ferritin family protein [Caldisericota bacterium]
MTTKTVFYSVMGHSRTVAEGVASELNGPLFGLSDRFTARPSGWKRAARRAVRGFDLAVLSTPNVSFDRGDKLVLVFPYWNGAIVPAVSGFVRSVGLAGVTVFLVMMRRLSGGDELISQLEDDVVRQGGTIGGVFSLRTLWRVPQRLRSLGSRLGRQIGGKAQGALLSLQELLEGAIEEEVEGHARYLQLVERTTRKRLKATFRSLSADEAAHVQMLQQLYRAYAGIVYEPHRKATASSSPEKVLDDSALLQELSASVEAERKAFMGYRAIAERYSSQPDVVRQMLSLAHSDLQHYRDVKGMCNVLSRRHSKP